MRAYRDGSIAKTIGSLSELSNSPLRARERRKPQSHDLKEMNSANNQRRDEREEGKKKREKQKRKKKRWKGKFTS